MGIAKHLLQHLGLTLLVTAFWIWQTGNWFLLLPAFIFGILVDLDHWFDYFAFFGFKIDLKKFFDTTSYIKPSRKVYVFFHGWEYLLFLFFLLRFLEVKFSSPGLTGVVLTTYSVHLAFDTITVNQSPKSYSLVYRWLNKFKLEAFNEK